MRALIDRFFFRRVDAASLAVFRMMFGGMILFEAVNYGIFLDLDDMYRQPDLLFKYMNFEWAVLPPGPGLGLLFLVMGIASIGVMLGAWYRLSVIVMTLSFGYHFLLDQALYLNHFYLALLFATILIFVPAHTLWSVDAWRRPALRSQTVPNWGRFWLGAQLEIVLVYAGLVKLNMDWLQLEPMRLWMNWESRDAAPFFQWLTQDWGIAIASYSVIALHLIGAPLLLWRRTRLAVFCVYAFFHLTNAFVFNIGIFPFMTIAATLLLFDPDWPRQAGRRWQAFRGLSGTVDAVVDSSSPQRVSTSAPWRAFIVASITLWLVVQILVPLRHYTRDGEVAWNEDGHRYSWRMKLRSKIGETQFVLRHSDGTQQQIDPAVHLNARQVRKMACIPDLIWQFAQFAEQKYRKDGTDDPAVFAWTSCSLNTRDAVPLVRRDVDLTRIERDTPSGDWLLPNHKPLPRFFF